MAAWLPKLQSETINVDSIVLLFVNPDRNPLLIGPHSFSRLNSQLFPKPTIQHLQPWAHPRTPYKRQDIESDVRPAQRQQIHGTKLGTRERKVLACFHCEIECEEMESRVLKSVIQMYQPRRRRVGCGTGRQKNARLRIGDNDIRTLQRCCRGLKAVGCTCTLPFYANIHT